MQPPTGGGDGFVRKGERGSQRVGRCAGNHDNLRYCRDCSSLPGLNRTALPGGMATSSPVRGMPLMPVLRWRTLKMPKPRNSMRSPCDRALFILSKTVSTAISVLLLVMPVLFTTSLIMSSLITVSPSAMKRARRAAGWPREMLPSPQGGSKPHDRIGVTYLSSEGCGPKWDFMNYLPHTLFQRHHSDREKSTFVCWDRC